MEAAYVALRGASPLGIIADPDDIARWVAALCDPAETFTTGAVLAIDGGQTLNGWASAIADAAGAGQLSGGDRGVLKKLINDPFDAVDEMLEGFVAAHADLVRLAAPRVVARRTPGGPKVGLVIGGGSGHEPAFGGYVGTGLADAAALGNVFAAPGPDVCLDGDPGRLVGSRRPPRLRQLRR